ncbi:mitochondrial m-AAA+ ATPase [Andalucia godoyi]|uniref:Mitochondrial m-AAA+ ATPase n=1 Tax=Andalucia godoyi TaxID=505711 RepID=A0A8K0AIM7_ANDGO|nr:mitochondrial m-AAA+ ATPase [Andalucia godoyi]|eukprot:ANDGO_05423.mRNA.1 mitochondrial m-AAA+ ATPase [Yta10(Agf3)/Yta12(Rca1) homolog]
MLSSYIARRAGSLGARLISRPRVSAFVHRAPFGGDLRFTSFTCRTLQSRPFSTSWLRSTDSGGDVERGKQETQKDSRSKKSTGDDSNGNGPSKTPPSYMKYVPLGIAVLSLPFLIDAASHAGEQQITFQELLNDFLKQGRVLRLVVVNESHVRVFVKPRTLGDQQTDEKTVDFRGLENNTSSASVPSSSSHAKDPVYYFTIGSVESFEHKLDIAQKEAGIPVSQYVPVAYVTETSISSEMLKLLPTLLLIGGFLYINRNAGQLGGRGGAGGMFSVGKAKPQVWSAANSPKVKFQDVAGMDEAKVEIMEFVQFLRSPEKFIELGAHIPKGALLVGPPGTGKTLLAKAVAGEASVPFFSISGSDFIEMFVGVGPARVRDLFSQARKAAPCIVFIDEIDAVGRQRGRGSLGGASDERDNTLNQLLVEMDGFSSSTGVIVLAGTNRADILDKALLRPGRFDRQIQVDAPDFSGREAIFKIHLQPLTVEKDLSLDTIARRLSELTPGFVGADIANVCNEAALIAARRNADFISLKDFEAAIDRVVGGIERKARKLSEIEKRVVAYHEAGHAVVGWFLKYTDPLVKVSIVPRGKAALGYAQYLPQERFITTQVQMLDFMCMALGGRAAEQVIFGHLSTGAQDDLQRVTKMAYAQVCMYGMSSRLGPLSFPLPHEQNDSMQFQKPYSQETATVIDDEASLLVQQAYERTLSLLQDHKEALEKIAQLLLQQEVISQDDISRLIGNRPFGIRKHVFDDYGILEGPPSPHAT